MEENFPIQNNLFKKYILIGLVGIVLTFIMVIIHLFRWVVTVPKYYMITRNLILYKYEFLDPVEFIWKPGHSA
jgi:hypothetical protein